MGKKLLLMAGGTGGHVFTAIAVAQELQQHGWEIRWSNGSPTRTKTWHSH